MRMIRPIRVSLFVALALALPYLAVAQPKAPTTAKKPHVTKIHGDTLVDNYFWLREKSNRRHRAPGGGERLHRPP